MPPLDAVASSSASGQNRPHRFVWVAAIALLAIFIAFLIDGFHHIAKGELGAFATYYKAAGLLRMGQSPYGRLGGYPYVYPPLWAWLCQPLASLSSDNAARVMMSLNGLFLFGAIFLSARSALKRLLGSAPLAHVLPVTLVALFLVSVQLHKELRSFQTDLILMLGFVLAIVWLDRRPRWAGAALAFVICVKYVPLIAAPYLVLRRQWAVLLGLAGGLVLWTLLPATTLGMGNNLNFLKQSISGLSHLTSTDHVAFTKRGARSPGEAQVHSLTGEMDHSISSAVARFAHAMHWPSAVGLALIALIAIAWLLLVFARTSGSLRSLFLWPPAAGQQAIPYRQRVALEWAAVMTAAMVFSPSSLLILAIYPAAMFAAAWLYVPAARRSPGLVAGGLVLFLSLLLPFASLGHPFTLIWNTAGITSWMLMASTTLLIFNTPSYSSSTSQPTDRTRKAREAVVVPKLIAIPAIEPQVGIPA